MNEVEIAYMAGLFDGEGCIHIAKLKRPESQRGLHFGLLATVGMTSERSVRLYHSRFGGSVYHYKQENKRKPNWQWVIRSRQAIHFLRTIRPHLILKAPEADLAIEFQEAKHLGGRRTDEEWALQQTQYILMRNLKNITENQYGQM